MQYLIQSELFSLSAVLAGSLLMFGAHLAALLRHRDLLMVVLLSFTAELGTSLAGYGTGTVSGLTGSGLHLLYQTTAHLTAMLALISLGRGAGSFRLDALTGIGSARPVTSAVFGFAMVASLGLTPFKGAISRPATLYGMVETGQWIPALLVLAGTVLALWYTLKIVLPVCFSTDKKISADQVETGRAPFFTPLALILAGVLAVLHAMPETVVHWVEHLASLTGAPGHLPRFESPWPAAATVPYVGGFMLVVAARFLPRTLKGLPVLETGAALLSAASLALVFTAGVSPLSLLFAAIMGFISLAVIVYSAGYMRGHGHASRYWLFLLLMQGSLTGLCLARDLGSLYGFWELMTLSSAILVIHDQTGKALRAGFKYFFMCGAGAYALLFGILVLHAGTGSFEFTALAAAAPGLSPTIIALTGLGCLIGFAVKAGLVPVHGWLPEAHPVAPSSVSGPLSGILTKTGIYGMTLVLFALFGSGTMAQGAPARVLELLPLLGGATLLFAEIMALRQTDLKRMLAYSTMAQVGEITAVLGLGTALAVTGAMAHVVNHAVMKNLLFFGAGLLILRAGTARIDDLKGMGRAMPLTGLCMLAGSLAIMGLPPFGGFASKFLMVSACIDAGRPLLATAILGGGLIGVMYYIRLVRVLFFEKYEGPAVAEAPTTCLIAMSGLALASLIMGVQPQACLALVSPVTEWLVQAGKIQASIVPDLAVTWPWFAVLPMLGAAVPFYFRNNLERSGWGTTAVLGVTFLAVALSFGSMDTMSLCFALLVVLMGALNTVYSVSYMDHSHTQWRFFAFFLVMIGGLLGVAGSPDLFSFFLFWEIMSSWTLYCVIVHEETPGALREGYKYFLFNVLGATCMFFGVVLLGTSAGSFDLTVVGTALGSMPGAAGAVGMGCIALGFAMKAAMLPLRIDIWMHPATAPTPVSGYISSVLLKSGPFGLMKLLFVMGGAGFFAGQSGYWSQPAIMSGLAWIAGITIVFAAAMALMQSGLKRMLIYSTVSQLGYIVLGIATGTSLAVSAGLLHFVNHMVFKNLIFLAAGAIMYRTHADSLEQLAGIGRKMPVTLAVFAVAAFSAIGLPPLNGFTSKWMLYHGLMAEGDVILAILSLGGSVLTMAYFLKFLHGAFFGRPDPRFDTLTEVGPLMRVPMCILAGACVVLGVFPGLALMPINGIIAGLGFAPLEVHLYGPASGAGAWNATAVAGLMLAAYLAARGILALMNRTERETHMHACGVDDLSDEQLHVSASGLYEPAVTLVRQWLALPGSLPIFNRKG